MTSSVVQLCKTRCVEQIELGCAHPQQDRRLTPSAEGGSIMRTRATIHSAWQAVALALVLSLSPPAGAAEEKAASTEKKATPAKLDAGEAAKSAAEHPFAAMAGSWSGGGTLSLSSGSRERLRCQARHAVGGGGKNLSLHIRCASDSYRFDLTSSVVNRRGRIYGRWNESSNGLSGTVAGHASSGRIRAVARSDTFTAGLSITTNGRRQTVSITPRQTFISGVYVALRKR
jgi:hypothetical protein